MAFVRLDEHTLTPDEVIAQIADWQGRQVSYEVLGGGITNQNFLVTVAGSGAEPAARYVLRIPGQGTDVFIDRTRELDNHVAAAASGVTPPLLHRIEPGPCTVVPFIDGVTLHPETIAGHPDHLDKIVRAVRTYHDTAVFGNEIHVFEMIREYTAMAHEVGATLPPSLEHMFPVGDAIELAMARDEPAPVACHCDLLSENFIVEPDGKLWVIDWEYGGMADPYFDLGDFCVEHPLSDAEERAILTAYCGAWDEHRYSRMMLYKLVADHWWSIWAMIQHKVSALDFDFHAYGTNRIERFWRNAGQPAFKDWLAQV